MTTHAAIHAIILSALSTAQALQITIDQRLTDADTFAFDIVWGENPVAHKGARVDVLCNYKVEGTHSTIIGQIVTG